LPTKVRRHCSIGSNATLLGGICIGEYALVGAGAVVTHDVPDYAVVAGVPARVIGDVRTARQPQNGRSEPASCRQIVEF